MSCVQEVVGIDPELSRVELAVRLLRPVAVLCALHLYRFGFAGARMQALLRPAICWANRCHRVECSRWLLPNMLLLCLPAVGTVVEQVAEEDEAPEALEARRLANQRGSAALLKRFFVLHGGKVVALAVWWAAIQRPGAIGWLLTGTLLCLSSTQRTTCQ